MEEVKEAIKKIGQSQPMNEKSINHELEVLLAALKDYEKLGNLDIVYQAAKTLVEFKQFNLFYKVVFEIMILCERIALQHSDQLKAWEIMRLVIDPERQIYRFYENLHINDTKFSQHPMTPEQYEFCQSLEENMEVDALKDDEKCNVICWSRGRIKKLSDKYVWVMWTGDDDSKRKIDRFSMDIAPFKSKVTDEEWEWRHTLQVGDVIDCLDSRVWQNSTVLERFDSPEIEYTIGFRIYDTNGNQVDAMTGKRFLGWNSQYDERIKATSPRIQKKDSFAKSYCKYSSMNYSEETIQDCNDFLYPQNMYAVPRFNTKSQRKSLIMIDLIQQFGEMKGFELILHQLQNKQQFCQIDFVHNYMVILGNIHEMLHRKFAIDYIPQVWGALQWNLLNSPDNNLRNFGMQKIQDILNGAGALLRRVFSLKEKQELIDKLDMDIAFKCFSSDFLERKLQGLKTIQELIKKTKEYQINMDNSDIKFLTNDIMVNWLNEKKIFETLYVNAANSHLVQRSAEFFKFLLEGKMISLENIQQMWNSISKGETEHKLAIYKLFKDVSSSLDKEYLDFLVNQICNKEANLINKDDIELLTDLTKYNYRFKEEYCQKFSDFYWDLLISNKLNAVMQEQFINYYIEQVTSFEMRPHKSSQIAKIGKSLIAEENVLVGLKVLMKFIEKLDIQPTSWEQYTRNQALTELEQNYNLIKLIIQQFNDLKQIQNETQYYEEVKMRMQFIQFFYQNIQTYQYRLTFNVISSLWESLVCQSMSALERDLVYKWFSALSSPDGQSQLSTMVPIDDLKSFFKNKMTADHNQLISLTEEGFNCFKTVLNTITKMYPLDQFQLDIIWLIILDNESEKVSHLAIEYYHSFQQDLDLIFEQINKNRDNAKRLYRCILVLEDYIEQSEINGVGNMKSLNALSKGEEVIITVFNEHTSQQFVPKKLSIKINDNQTIIELRQAISKQIKASWDSIGLNCTKGEIKATENGKMIKDLRLKKGESILCFKKNVKELPESALLDENQMLTPGAKEVFSEIFNEYSHEGRMSKEDCTRFVTGCTGNPCSVEDSNISRTFEQYDRDKDGILLLSDFLDFYTDSARTKKQTVWLNLQTLHYRNDLIRGDKVPLPVVDATYLPRGKIVQNESYLEVLFALLESPYVQEKAWHLLRRLPPSHNIVKKMLTFEGINSSQDWDTLLINSNYRLLYSLYIIEFLMSSDDPSALEALIQEEDQQQLISMRDKWMSKFLQLGGFDKLLSFFKFYQGKSVDTLTLIEKEILSFLLKTFSQYLIAACSIKVANMYRAAFVISDTKPLDQCLIELRSTQFEEPAEFKDLVQKLKESRLGESIIEKFEVEKFLGVLIQLVQDLLQNNELESEERQIIEYSIITILTILLYREDLLNSNLEKQEFINIIFCGIFTDKSINTRNLFSRAILTLCHESQRLNNQPTKIILEQLIKMQNQDKKNSAQYYELLCQLLESTFELEEGQQFIDFRELAENILNELINHQSCESRAKNTPVDRVLVGLLDILGKLLKFIDRPIIELIFNECLFNLHQEKEIKCKSQDSRAAAFKLLAKMCNNQQNLKLLLENIHQLSLKIPSINKWNYIPASDMRSQSGYCGIRNLRCICYMNAMLQQFYMTPPFRYGILQTDDKKPPDMQISKSGQEYDDNVLHQLQTMFAYLELSDRVDYNPNDFCFAFKDYLGEPVNINIQQDAQEFLNMIFDKLENLVKDTAYKYILDGVYGGKTCTQIVCSECKHSISKVEQFYNLSLTIKNLKSLTECFEKYIEGEVISDFKCSNCEKKVNVTKRQLLHQLPNVLILHLQRIVFNLDTFLNEKINSRLEFPMEMDLSEYVEETQKDQCTQYKLVGVVVHVGTAEVGHYFSYIDINRGEQQHQDQQQQQQQQSTWLEFNDSKIKEFKVKMMEQDCFGGQAGNDYMNDNDVWGMGMRENSQSAYMLVYEKVEKDPIKLVFKDPQELQKAKTQFNDAVQVDEEHLCLNYYSINQYVPEHLKSQVNSDNQAFLLERNLFSTSLMKFISEISDMVEGENVRPMIDILLRFNYDLLARAYDNNIMDQFNEQLMGLINKYPDDSYFDLVYNPNKVYELLLVCPETRTRKYFSKLLVTLFNQQISQYQLPLSNSDDRDTKIVQALDQMFSMIQEQVPKNWARFDQYFQFWIDFMNEGEVQCQYMMRKETVTYLLDFILDKHSPLQLYEKKTPIGNSYFQINYSLQLNIITTLLNKQGNLNYNDKRLLYCYKFYDKMLKNNKIDQLIPIILKFAQNNQYYSEIIAGCILRGLSTPDTDEFKNYLNLFKQFVQINDKYKLNRIEWIVGIPSAKQNTSNKVYDLVTKVPKIELPSFGVYGLQSLDEDIVTFTSPLGWQPTLMDYFTQNKTSKNLDTQCLLILKYFLMLSIEDQDAFAYFSKLACTNYQYKQLEEIFMAFIEVYNIDSKRYYSSYPRKQESEETKALLDQYIQMLQAQRNEFQDLNDFIIGKSTAIESLKRKLYLQNPITKEEITCEEDSEMYEQLKEQIEDGTLHKILYLEEKTIKTYICDNLPNGQTNEALPQQYVKGTQFYNYQVDANSPAANFIQSKAWAYEYQQSEMNQETEIKNVRQEATVKQISLNNNTNRNMHVILSIKTNENVPHFVPKSKIQSIMSPKSTAIMFTAIKNKSGVEFGNLELELSYKKQEAKSSGDGHVYLSSENEMNIDLLHNE